VYAHKDHFNIILNGHVSPVTESELRHLNRQNNKTPTNLLNMMMRMHLMKGSPFQ